MTVSTDSGRGALIDIAGERARAALADVQVGGGVVCSYRASLVADGLWQAVQLDFAARSGLPEAWLEQVALSDWVELAHFRTLLVSFAETTSLDCVRATTRRRMGEPDHSNVYAPMLRAWMRSFGDSVEHTLRCVAALWRTAFRHNPAPELLCVGPGEIQLVLHGPMARALHGCAALAAGFEGILLGILDQPQPRLLVDVEFCYERERQLSICRF